VIDQDRLLEPTESYLKALVSGVSGSSSAHFDSRTPFGELGVDSFRVLKILKMLEADFGKLPKTLLFEHFNVNDLARYFIGRHAPTLSAKFAAESTSRVAAVQVAEPARRSQEPSPVANRAAATSRPILLLEEQAYAHPQLGEWVRNTFDRYKGEGSVSRGTRIIAPNLFIGSERKGFFHYSRSKNLILAYAYTGPDDHVAALAGELCEHCCSRNLELSILAPYEITAVGEIPFSSTPFGVLQRILDLQSFTLEGAAMRRLRYQVAKFAKSGSCRTEEYRCASNRELAPSIASIIEQWCADRTMVNPLVHIVKEEILAGTLNPEHRIFVTSLNEALQNVILITPMSVERNGYLMDLEFYAKSMPLGGLEFAIVEIIKTLVAEGCGVLSLGGTYGCKLAASAHADRQVDQILDELRTQNIFNDAGNLQFKNKFRPENQSIYLCRPVDKSTPGSVIDIIMMIADPSNMQTSDEENQGDPQASGAAIIEGDNRSDKLSEFDFNPLNVPSEQVAFDLKTDSWAQLKMPAIERQTRYLHTQLQQPANLEQSLREIFPFAHFALTTSGRTAEGVFYRAWATKGIVPQNLLFPTTIFQQIDKGFTPRELPCSEVFQLGATQLYKGNLDWSALEQAVADPASIALACIELGNNAAGGYPVAIGHLQKVAALLKEKSIPLVLDATRIIENAQFVIENETGHAGKNVWDVAREIFGYADAVVVSLAKDFCVNGGLVATNDQKLFHRIQDLIREEGCGLNAIDRKLVALSLQDRRYIETQTLRRKASVQRIWTALREQGIPLVQPAGGHCILIDVKQMVEFSNFKYPVASFLAWLYLNAGIRAGAHNAGMQTNTAINGLVRLAIPVGLKQEHIDEIIARLTAIFCHRQNIPEIVLADEASASFGDIHAKYKLIRYHNLSNALVATAAAPASAAASQPQATQQRVQAQSASTRDVAVVGMAGRYPHAKNLQEMWDNLVQGKDCIEDIPELRLEQRLHNGFTRKYRGGFIDDVDQFDARFFGISPQEAEVLDPQERLFLEVACEAVEDAGYYPETLGREHTGREIGVFVGAVWSMYQMLGVEERIAGNQINPSSFFWSIANRVSYWMNLSGPSLTVDTACSASLTAIHLACESIHRGECSAAIVGGVNLDLHQSKFDINSNGGSFSKDGVCRSFGKGANGYVSGEGVGALFLKPLEQAIADGDNIHGVIKSVAVTHSGRTIGYTIPGPHSQSKLILTALERANIDARSIGYIEAHGTGTDLGDSIEIAGLTHAFQKYGVAKQSCAIGSVKTNMGHLEAAAGVVGVQKVLLQMKHRTLVPSLHSAELNESIDFAHSQFYVQQKVEPWQAKEVDGVRFPRRAGVSAMGAGGTNAHVILEEYETATIEEHEETGRKQKIFPVSASTEVQLREAAVRLRGFLDNARCSANDVAHTLQLGRKSFDHRLAVVATTLDELAGKLDAFMEGRTDPEIMAGRVQSAEGIAGFLNASEQQDFINLLVRSGDPRRLARLWSDGVIPDWQGLDIGQTGRKISLPTYPFAGERYWITNRKPAQLVASATEEEAHRSPARRSEKYQFSLSKDREAPGKISGLGLEDKARLFVRQMFANQLRATLDEVDDACQLMETGITSLDMAEMTQSIKKRLDPGFSPTAFFECTTVRSFAELLAQKYAAAFHRLTVTKLTVEDAETVVKLRKKVAPPEAKPGARRVPQHVQDAQSDLLLSDVRGIPDGYQRNTHCVLLTGATGFLGIHVLSELLSSDRQAQAYCLVRCSNQEQGLQRILKQAEKFELAVDETRIRVLCGDINRPSLGLSSQDWDLCCQQAQQIVHASAHVNHIEGYATFRDSARGMKEVLRLAGSHQLKLIQFISSVAACALKTGEEFSIFEKEGFLDDGEHVYGGYGQSKWVQETLLKRAHDSGIPYVIYRFGELSGSAQTGLGQTDDMLHRLLQMRLAIGCKEKISSDVLDMLPVDFAAQLIVNTGKRPELWNAIVHATHLQPYSFANLYRKAQANGLQFTPVTRTQYLSTCYDFVRFIHSINPVYGFVLECVLRDAEGSSRSRKMMDGYFAVIFPFDQDNFRRSLTALGLALPDWNSLIDRYFERWSREDCGFMARIRDYQQWAQLEGHKGKVVHKSSKQETLLLGKVSEA
jgi:polyketide synthase PksN